MSHVPSAPPTDSADAVAHFAARLRFETDVSDVHANLEAGGGGVVVVDSRSAQAWRQGHLPGAVHLPTREIADRAASVVPPGRRADRAGGGLRVCLLIRTLS